MSVQIRMTPDQVAAEDCLHHLKTCLWTHEKELFYEKLMIRRQKVAVEIPRFASLNQGIADIVILQLARWGWSSEWIDANPGSTHSRPAFLCWMTPNLQYNRFSRYFVSRPFDLTGRGTLAEMLETKPVNGEWTHFRLGEEPRICLDNDITRPHYIWDDSHQVWHITMLKDRGYYA